MEGEKGLPASSPSADDKRLLARLVDWYESGQLQVHSLVLVRHAKAVSRATWGYGINSEITRPLVMGRGQAQARDVAALLSAYGVGDWFLRPGGAALTPWRPMRMAAAWICAVTRHSPRSVH